MKQKYSERCCEACGKQIVYPDFYKYTEIVFMAYNSRGNTTFAYIDLCDECVDGIVEFLNKRKADKE